MSLISLISDLLNIGKRDLVASAIYAIFIGIFSLLLPIAIQEIVNIIAYGIIFQPLIVLTIILVFFLFIMGIFQVIEFYIAEIIQHKVFVRYITPISKLIEQKKHLLTQHLKEEIHLVYEVFLLQKSYQKILSDGLLTSITAIMSIAVLTFYHYYFSLLSVILCVLFFISFFLGGKNGVRTAYLESDNKYKIFNLFTIHSQNKNIQEALDIYSKEYLVSRTEHIKILIRQKGLLILTSIIANAYVLGIGGLLVIEERLGLGQLISAEIILNIAFTSINKITNLLPVYFDLTVHLKKIEKLKGHLYEIN